MDLGSERGSLGRRRRLSLDPSQFNVESTEIFIENSNQLRGVAGQYMDSENSGSGVTQAGREDNPVSRVTLSEVEQANLVNNKLSSCTSSEEYFELGRQKGIVEGKIEGYIMAMINMTMDLEEINHRLVLTFNLTPTKAESYIKQFYDKRQIVYEEP